MRCDETTYFDVGTLDLFLFEKLFRIRIRVYDNSQIFQMKKYRHKKIHNSWCGLHDKN